MGGDLLIGVSATNCTPDLHITPSTKKNSKLGLIINPVRSTPKVRDRNITKFNSKYQNKSEADTEQVKGRAEILFS